MKKAWVRSRALHKRRKVLSPSFYADPTAEVDRQIARAELTIEKAKARIERLTEERNRILAEREGYDLSDWIE